MTAPTLPQIAEDGYQQALRLLKKGEARSVALWRDEALEKFGEAFSGGFFLHSWMQQLSKDLGDDYSVVIDTPAVATYCADREDLFVLIAIEEIKTGRTMHIILTPQAPYIQVIVKARWF